MSRITIDELKEKLSTMDLESQKKLLMNFIQENTAPEVLESINTANSSLEIARSLMTFYETTPIIKSEVRK
jgi:hypothetical protein